MFGADRFQFGLRISGFFRISDFVLRIFSSSPLIHQFEQNPLPTTNVEEPGYRYFSRPILARHFRISARARKARTLTSETDQPVSCAISFTDLSSISSNVM